MDDDGPRGVTIPKRPLSASSLFLIVASIALGCFVFTYLAVNAVKARYDDDLRAQLSSRLLASKNALDVWHKDQAEDIESLVNQDIIALSTQAILNAGSQQLKNRRLSQFFLSLIENTDYLGLSITDLSGRVLFSESDAAIDRQHPVFVERPQYVEHTLSQDTVFIPPFLSDELSTQPWMTNKAVAYFSSTIFLNGNAIGFLHARINPYSSFSKLTKSTTFAKTGETYAVDHSGFLLTPSRFQSSLIRKGLLQPQQLSVMRIGYEKDHAFHDINLNNVQSDTYAKIGIDLSGCENYLNDTVVRAYLWFTPMDVGLISEQNFKEAYKGYLFVRDTFIAAAIAIVSMLIFGILYIYRASVRHYVFAVKHNQDLENRVALRTKELERSESFLAQIMDNLPLLVAIKDPEGRYQYINRQFESIFNISRDALLGKTDHVLCKSEDADRFMLQTRAIFHEKRAVRFEECIIDSDGAPRDHLMVKLPLFKDGQVDSILTVGVDISERKQFEREMTQAKIEAERANQAKSEFLASMSHELHTPMNGLLGMQSKLQTTQLDSDQMGYLSIAQDCAYNLLNTINDILDLSKLDVRKITLDKKAFDVHHLLEQAFENHKLAARRKQLDYQLDNQAGHLKILGDSIRLLQILNNLISNAIKFTEHGFVRIQCRTVKKQKARIKLRFIVEDSGIGFDDHEAKALFERFKQLDETPTRQHDGLGVGLSIVHELITLMGGRIKAEGKRHEGAKFIVDLDFTPVGEEEFEYQLEREEYIEADDPTIIETTMTEALLVEDNPINQIVAEELLSDLNVRCHMASNGHEAIEMLKTMQPPPNIIFMDCRMPVMDGYETTRQIRQGVAGEAVSQLPIIALTANNLEGDKEKCLAAGMTDFVGKPYTRGELQSVLTQWAKQQHTVQSD